MDQKLALDGGTPVRSTPFPPYYPGAMLYDSKEAEATSQVVYSHSPFRYYGPDLQGKVKQFETEIAQKMGTRYAVAVSSGTAAVITALKAAGIGPGDKVIVPACTFLATAGAVICAGAVPVFAEIDESLSLDPDHLEEVIDKDTKAVIPVPILGNPCQIDRILEIAGRHHLTVIEDAAQSCGASYHGKRVGTSGQINTFSLQMNKIMTTGEGGVVVTDDPKLYERAVRYHDQGMFRESEGFLNSSAEADVFVGQNYRMSEFSGAVALEQVRKLDEMLEKMRWAKRAVKEQLKGTPGFCFRRINDEEGDAGNALILLLDDPARVQPFLDAICAEGVPFSRLYNGEPVYMNPQILYQRTPDGSGFPFSMVDPPVAYTPDMCPISVGILSRNVELMIGTTWTQQDIEDVVHAVRKVASAVL
ncbi:MAG TPA: DegT/DnrJ/EryC1/StrS family aminotransferase [Firmicutes bacterium]|nr:DegT/DnrJ/EryC1/StrS family aminotransferase [Bacillota bacterium]